MHELECVQNVVDFCVEELQLRLENELRFFRPEHVLLNRLLLKGGKLHFVSLEKSAKNTYFPLHYVIFNSFFFG